MSSEMVIYSEEDRALLARLDLGIEGEENIESGDIGLPPRLRISQPNRRIEIGGEEVDAGLIVNTLSGETWNQVNIVPLVFLPKTRVMWPERFSADSKPECASDDGKHPNLEREDLTDPQRGPCATCPMSQFVDGNKPRCTMQRNFLVWLTDTSEPAILTMQSTAIKEARTLTSLAKMSGIKKAIVLATRKVNDDRGSWFVPQFIRGDALSVETIIMLAETKKELSNLVIMADTDRQENGASNDNVVIEQEEIPF